MIPGKSVAIVQSNYIPWKGYFDLINAVDEFILYDDMQFTRRDWRNRNQIKAPNGLLWLTIPVESKGKYLQRVNETMISDPDWKAAHWRSIVHSYRRAAGFMELRDDLEDLYLGADDLALSAINYRFISRICAMLGIQTRLSWSSDYRLETERNQRLVSLCHQVGASIYVTGPSAKAYLDETVFRAEGLEVRYFDYQGYPEYEQLYPPFIHQVSVVDLLLSTGSAACRYLKSNQPQ